MGTNVIVGITAASLIFLVIGLLFGISLGVMWAEPKYQDPSLHEGEWERVTDTGNMVTWRRQTPRRKNCHDDHRAYVCTIDGTTWHVDACDCGATRQGVYGQWS